METTTTVETLIEIENYGLGLTFDISRVFPYRLEISDPFSPGYRTEEFTSADEAINRMVELILDPDQVYAMEEMPYEFRRAYMMIAKFAHHKETCETFLRSVLEGIVYAKSFSHARNK